MSLRLCSLAPLIVINIPFPFLLFSGSGMYLVPFKYRPVSDFSTFSTASTVPSATTCPPCSPAPGPISTIQSAARIVSSSCSTTINVFPKSLIPLSVAKSLSLSLWCNPIDGSSRMYKTPTSPDPICVARRIRCASPPESVVAVLPNVR